LILNQTHHQHGLTLVIDEQGHKCTTKEDVEEVCLKENQEHFNQACDTPLFQEPLFSMIGPIRDGPEVDSILWGDDLPGEIEPMIQKIFHSLLHCDPNNTLGPLTFSASDYKSVWS